MIKRLSFLLVIVIIAAALAGCSKPVDASESSPFAVYRIKDGMRFSLGDKRENVEKIFADERTLTVEFDDATGEEQVFEHVAYDDIGVAFDYDRAGNVLGVQARSSDWKIANGLKVTDSAEDVKRKYPPEYLHTYPDNDDLYFALNENGEITEFADDAPYILRFDIEQYAIDRIIIQKNIQ